MKGTKLVVFGIAVALSGLAASTMNFFGLLGGGIGLLIALIGLIKND